VGRACPGSSGLPRLTSNAPFLGNRTLVLAVADARQAAPCLFALAPTTQSIPIGGGCTLYVRDPFSLLATSSNGVGFATLSFTLPLLPALRGTTLFAQAFVLDPGGSVLGLAFTAGRRLVLGD
jgi:hypothetical protein